MLFFPSCQHFDCLSPTAVEMIWKTFALRASVGRFKHRKSLSHAVDVTAVKVNSTSCIVRDCHTTPTPRAHRAEQRRVRSKPIDRPSVLECNV